MSNKIRTKSFKDKLKAAKMPQRIVPICLRGDLISEIQALSTELGVIQEYEMDTDRLVGNPEAKRLAADIERLRAEMRDDSEDFVIRGMAHSKWNDLRAQHPPRDNDPRDFPAGVNVDTFNAALLPLSIISPEMDEDDWTALVAALTDGQYEELINATWGVNRAKVDVPFSQAALTIQKSGSESKRPNA